MQYHGPGSLGPIPEACHFSNGLVIYDEILFPPQLKAVATYLRQDNIVALASHLHPCCFLPFRLWHRARLWRTDHDHAKIARYLEYKQVISTQAAVRHYCQTFGANYTDVDIILERYPSQDFDHALAHFLKRCTLKRTPSHITQ